MTDGRHLQEPALKDASPGLLPGRASGPLTPRHGARTRRRDAVGDADAPIAEAHEPAHAQGQGEVAPPVVTPARLVNVVVDEAPVAQLTLAPAQAPPLVLVVAETSFAPELNQGQTGLRRVSLPLPGSGSVGGAFLETVLIPECIGVLLLGGESQTEKL